MKLKSVFNGQIYEHEINPLAIGDLKQGSINMLVNGVTQEQREYGRAFLDLTLTIEALYNKVMELQGVPSEENKQQETGEATDEVAVQEAAAEEPSEQAESDGPQSAE